ncbi:BLUF domain-containing protein [Amnibacterium endophyticum]|uniref:BLUF domain-containing protein n=1 Tax=Amnibacterium endophyticum TaxID=2109337 RepID=A0ABW4LHI9_9MICO
MLRPARRGQEEDAPVPQRIDDPPLEGVLLSVVYSSVATRPFSDAALVELLALSRARNAGRDLTGLLLHRDGQFMQVLEGPERAVRGLLATIAADPRHSGVWVLDEERVGARRFGSWSMAYRGIEESDREAVPEWFGSADGAGPAGAGRAAALLDWFRHR